ncbi:MAG: hypothetical protein ACXW1W_05395 [Methylococcaceae bacterium]
MAEEKKQENNGLTTTIPVTVMLAGLVFTHSLPYRYIACQINCRPELLSPVPPR